jgi:hypothetical protein
MSDRTVNFQINIGGNAYSGVATLNAAMGNLNVTADKTTSLFDRLGAFTLKLNNIFLSVGTVVRSVTSTMRSFEEANRSQAEAETKLAQVMRNTMNASRDEYDAILRLTAAQQRLGVVGDEVQLAGAQELGTYVTKQKNLAKLIPVMNDMVAQQYGYNATQESAVNIATMMGKVMDGQVGALSRYGYKFDEAQAKILKFGTEEQRAATLADVVAASVGGVNAALAETPEGKMKQLENSIGDVKERVGSLWMEIKGQLAPAMQGVVNRLNRIIDRVNALGGPVEIVRRAVERVRVAVQNTATAIRDILPIIAGVTVAIGAITVAMKWQDIVLSLLIAKEAIHTVAINAVTAATAVWKKVQLGLNAVLTANPIGLIVAAIAVLIGVIIWLVSHIKGWGTVWKAVVGFCTNSWKAFTSEVSYLWEKVSNGIMVGMDKIRMAWYKFKETLGLGDSDANKDAIAKLSADVKRRQDQMAKASNEAGKYARAAADAWKGVDLKWEKTDYAKVSRQVKQKLGITDRSVTSNVTNENGDTLNNTLTESSETINAGGKNIRNFNITINDGLISRVENHFASTGESPESASDFMSRLRDALLMVVNDVNYAGQ